MSKDKNLSFHLEQSNNDDDIVIKALKEKYFAIVSKENIGHTPDLTKQADNLEAAIRKLTKKEL